MQSNITEPNNTPSPKTAPPETALFTTAPPYNSTYLEHPPPLNHPRTVLPRTPCKLLASTTTDSSRARLLCNYSQADSFNGVKDMAESPSTNQAFADAGVTPTALQHC